jgi:RNA polymerase sigma-70 factor (ECF subfamily)
VRADIPTPGTPGEVRGARAWASSAIVAARGARVARPALVNGAVGVVVAPQGRLFRVLQMTVRDGKIVQIEVIGDPDRLRQLDLAVLD